MQQVIQHVRTGVTSVREMPDPVAGPHEVLVDVRASLISTGTERYVVDLAKKRLLAKARARPDQVRRVLQKLRQEGVVSTARQVWTKLEDPMPLGYSAAGVVLEAGRSVQQFKPGDRVAVAAPHAGIVATGANLCAAIPDEVELEHGAYAALAAIALQGVRLTKTGLGDRVLVIGLGLVGQLALCFLKAQSCRVFALDLDEQRCALAQKLGADGVGAGRPVEEILAMCDGHGIDACIIAAATDSNEPIELAAELCRPKGRIVMVGVAGMDVPRPSFFRKELELTVSNSLGAGRTDRRYEEQGQDYPIGYARWTVQRNMRAALETMAAGRLPVELLTTHRFDIDRAADAYALITEQKEPHLGVCLRYPNAEPKLKRRVKLRSNQKRKAAPVDRVRVSVIGAGNFARLVLLPSLASAQHVQLRGLCSSHGMNAMCTGERHGFEFAATDAHEILDDADCDAVFIATRHDSHAELALAALRRGKHVFVEKPLCITPAELEALESSITELGHDAPVLSVGCNRRFAPAVRRIREHFRGVAPLSISFRFGAGELDAGAWPQDDEVGGGRLIGEAVHAIDTCTAIAGSPPLRVYAESTGMVGGSATTDDRVCITLRHENGALSNVSYQAGNDRGGPKERLEVFGGGRSAFVDDFASAELWRNGSLKRHRAGVDKGHGAGVRSFVDACRGGPTPIPIDQLFGVAWASLMAVRSLRDGMPVSRLDAPPAADGDDPCSAT